MDRIQSLFLTALILLTQHTFAIPIPQDGDGGGTGSIPDGSLGYDPSAEGDATPGSQGTDGGAKIGKGAIIGISVVAALIVIAGGQFLSTSLFHKSWSTL
jgi:hypothetical protein